jgi:hypothetical protein
MQKVPNIKVFIILITALVFSMYQDTEAQRKKSPAKKLPTIAARVVAPNISYTVSMSKPWTHLLEVEMRLNWGKYA